MSPEAQAAFAECGAFYRDTVLPTTILSLYKTGTLFRELTFCDATYKFGGFAAADRYLIISANAHCIDELSEHPEWGLCVWQTGSIFKVIGHHQSDRHSQITLLEVPEEFLDEFLTPDLSEMEQYFSRGAEEQFQAALQTEALEEHQTRLWLDRLIFPVGVDDDGHFFECWHHSN
ncbi:hypothetical protein [Desulfosudis oleivorans]|uniref:Uncharacterized protein n=1 Tax=Desulfosudis oleivorans (strain DSM 6200 / JCM 39069 / Hxd3) TaxID=96561 RepID=A8ZUV4_DESOH|nr:hypothetical protein [Desulfosudis oleivorans]ABW68044.1 conserved hypothetical protein [Desulfosudis oleivorans Hxd3]